jgi:hypothetical protein
MLIFAKSHKKGECVFILLEQDMDRSSFLARIRAKEGSYAWEFGCRLYEALFCGAVDVLAEYERYYRPEYLSPIRYIASEYGLTRSDLKIIESHIAEKGRVLYTNLYESCESRLASYMFSEEMRKTLQDIMKRG